MVEEDDGDAVARQALARALDGALHVLGREALARRRDGSVQPNLGDDHDVVARRREPTEELLHGAGSHRVGGVEERHANLEGAGHGALGLSLGDRAVAVAREAPGAEGELGDDEASSTEGALSHEGTLTTRLFGGEARSVPEALRPLTPERDMGDPIAARKAEPISARGGACDLEWTRRRQMRNVTMGLVLSLSLAACGGATPEPEVARPTSSETTSNAATTAPTAGDTKNEAAKPALADVQKKILAAYSEAMVGNDAKKLAAFYTDDAVVNMAGMPEVKGRDAIEKMNAEWHAAFPHEKFGFTRVWMKNDVVISEWAAIGEHAGDFMGVKATNKPMSLMGLTISWTDESGKIKKQNIYADTGSVMAQIGAAKAKTRARR